MELSKHVLKALDECEIRDFDSALMHACFALEATARKHYRTNKVGKRKYKELVTEYIWIVEAMLGYGINLVETRWTNAGIIDEASGKEIKDPIFADIIYHIFRCSHAHAWAIPKNYALLPAAGSVLRWEVGGGTIRMPQLIVYALISISVFCNANSDITTGTEHWISLGKDKFLLKQWWGGEDRFKSILRSKVPNPTRVKFDIRTMTPNNMGIVEVSIYPPRESVVLKSRTELWKILKLIRNKNAIDYPPIESVNFNLGNSLWARLLLAFVRKINNLVDKPFNIVDPPNSR